MLKMTEVPLYDIKPYGRNAKLHPAKQIEQIKRSIREFGNNDPIAIDENGVIIEGHGRYMALKELGCETALCIRITGLTEDQKRAYRLVHNKLTMNSGFDLSELAKELDAITSTDMGLYDFDYEQARIALEDAEAEKQEAKRMLSEDFGVPPFSVLDARKGYWQQRKRKLNAVLKSRQGRNGGLNFSVGLLKGSDDIESGTSVFDPVLAEILLRWFAPEGGTVLDPFAGGSTRGCISELLGHKYTGFDVSRDQIEADKATAGELGVSPTYVNADSRTLDQHIAGPFDFVLTCPPYFDLERYSPNDPADISNLSFEGFCEAYSEIIGKAVAALRPNRFAAVVIGDVRDRKGFYRDLPGLTVKALEAAGARLYDDIAFVRVAGSAPIRARKAMKSRKLICVHEHVLVGYNGDPKEIAKEFGELNAPTEGE